MAKNAIIDSLEEKIEKLIEDHDKLLVENKILADNRDKVKNENRELKENITALEKRIANLLLAGGLAGSATDNKKAQARINKLMREIDSCIALMNK